MTTMADWAPVIVGVILLVILSPGLLFSLPRTNRGVDFGNLKINGKAIAVHTLILLRDLLHFDHRRQSTHLHRLILFWVSLCFRCLYELKVLRNSVN
ncbi:hypothetical protein BRARA_F01310 [Brassica rapa]|uniref:Uncharacterized protein n=1 Tax=Brassica campestris TaxID=3711 RepID=A0A397YXD1_BRACM|nr:hypothetical protein BRARA_F01310 [Brassica rapa]